MDAQVQETFEPPTINSYRRQPSREQIRYAMDLCRTELSYAERLATIKTFSLMSAGEISGLIGSLRDVRAKRLARLRRTRPRR